MDEIGKAALTMTPCEICAMLGTSRRACVDNSYKCCLLKKLGYSTVQSFCEAMIRQEVIRNGV